MLIGNGKLISYRYLFANNYKLIGISKFYEFSIDQFDYNSIILIMFQLELLLLNYFDESLIIISLVPSQLIRC